jgi:hypothetical protein
MGPAATTTADPLLFPAARLSARGPERQGRLTAPATPAGLGPVLDPPVRSHGHGSDQGNRRRQSRTPALSRKPAKTLGKTP